MIARPRDIRAAAATVTCALAASVAVLASTSDVATAAGASSSGIAVIAVHLSGQLTVDFHGSTAAGCARHGLCGYSGSLQWAPGSGELVLISRPHHPGTRRAMLLVNGGTTSAQVQASASGGLPAGSASCLDERSDAWQIPLELGHGRVRFGLTASLDALLGARCAGPRDRDVLGRLPVPSLTYAAALHGRAVVSLAAYRRFSSGGFAGAIRSSLKIALGRPSAADAGFLSLPLGPARRDHALTISYRATLGGTEVKSFTGGPNSASCGPLGSCGATGTITLTPPAAPAPIAVLRAEGRARVRLSDLRGALGLGGGRPVHGVSVAGAVAWTTSGTLQTSVIQGPLSCVDSAPSGAGVLLLGATSTRLTAQYLTPAAIDGEPVTRCPGPLSGPAPLASGSVPLSALAAPVVHVQLRSAGTFVDDGYTGRNTSTLTLTLTRTRIRASYLTVRPGSLASLLFGT